MTQSNQVKWTSREGRTVTTFGWTFHLAISIFLPRWEHRSHRTGFWRWLTSQSSRYVRYLQESDLVRQHDEDLPLHLQELYQTPIEQTHLSSDLEKCWRTCFLGSATFATSNTDLGYCDVLQHDIDTGDAAQIKQSPRYPPLAAAAAEDVWCYWAVELTVGKCGFSCQEAR